MARSLQSDFLHDFRFHVSTSAATGTPGDINSIVPEGYGAAEAGFATCSAPEATVETVEYKEGQMLYTRKYPGHVTYNNVTLGRGVAKVDTGFFRWIRTVIEGGDEYRVEVTIRHFHRGDSMPGRTDPPSENYNFAGATPFKQYRLYQALPVRNKFTSDMDSSSSAVSMQELELAYEHAAILGPDGKVLI